MKSWIVQCLRLGKYVLIFFISLLHLSGCTGNEQNPFDSPSQGILLEKGQRSQTSPSLPALNTELQTSNTFEQVAPALNGSKEVIAAPTLTDVLTPGDLTEMFIGRPDAPVTLVLYASLSCPYCKIFWRDVFPQVKKDYLDNGKVRLVVREFPIGKSSGNATIALRCAHPNQYFVLFTKYLENQSLWVSQEVRLEQIFAIAQQVGMKREKFDSCLQNQSLIDSLQRVKDRGRRLGVVGTPNFFIQNILVKKTLSLEEIRAMIDPLLIPLHASTGKDESSSH